MVILIIVASVVAADQITKFLIRSNFVPGETLPLIPDVLHLTFVRNRGAAFSMFQDQRVVTVLLPILLIAACAAAVIILRRKLPEAMTVALSMIIAGGIGNLIDRIAFGWVTDMIDFRVFPVFNVADISVTCGCLLAIVYLLFFDKEEDR